MKKLLMAGAALAVMASAATAERYVVITHTQGTDPFWPVVEKGARDAAAALQEIERGSHRHTADAETVAELLLRRQQGIGA